MLPRKYIGRKPEAERNEGSLIENTINNLAVRNRLIKYRQSYAITERTEEEQSIQHCAGTLYYMAQ